MFRDERQYWHRLGFFAATILCLMNAVVEAADRPELKGRIQGTVTDVETGKPIAGAKVAAWVGEFKLDIKAAPSTLTDAEGHYSLPVRLGHVALMQLEPPVGYHAPSDENSTDSPTGNPLTQPTALTPENPTLTADWKLQSGPSWKLRVKGIPADVPSMQQCLFLTQNGTNKRSKIFFREGETGDVCLFNDDATYSLELAMQFKHVCDVKNFSLKTEAGFQPEQIRRTEVSGNSTTMVDEQGKQATLLGAQLTKEGDEYIIDIDLDGAIPFNSAIGNLVDERDQPVQGAEVRIVYATGNMGIPSFITTTTDLAGTFHFPRVPGRSSETDDLSFYVTVSAVGYNHAESKPYRCSVAGGETFELGTTVLQPENVVKVKVVDLYGGPVAGAMVSTLRSTYTTDAEGRCLVNSVRPLQDGVLASFGNLVGVGMLPDAETDELLIRAVPAKDVNEAVRTAAMADTMFNQPGLVAPEFQVKSWTDGKSRMLAELKGKVVVLFFWSRHEEHCKQMMTTIQELSEQYSSENVVFLGIHPPDEPAAVQEFMKSQDWNIPTGVDHAIPGEKLGSTLSAYQSPESAAIVIGADHRVSFNMYAVPDDGTVEMLHANAMHALKIPTDAEGNPVVNPDDTGCEPCARMMHYIYSQAIDGALKAGAKNK